MWAVLISFLSASIASFAHGKYMHVHGVCMCKCKHLLNLELFVERHVPRLRWTFRRYHAFGMLLMVLAAWAAKMFGNQAVETHPFNIHCWLLPKNIGKVWNGDDDVDADDDDDEDEDEDADDDVPIFESTGGVWIQATFPGGLCRKKQTPRISWLMKWIVHQNFNRPLWSPRMHVSYQCICLKWSSFKFLKSMALRFISL